MNFRKTRFTDISEIEKLEEKSFKDSWNHTMISDSFLSKGFVSYVCMDGKKLAGYIIANSIFEDCEILRVAVAEEYKRQGIATSLLDRTVEEALKLGAERLLLEVRRSNFAAQKCYVKYGFEYVAIREGYYGNNEDAIIFEKHIKQ